MYNPKSDKLIHMIKVKDEMITIPDIGNTQAYSDDESSKATKIAQKMHNFIVNKTVLEQKFLFQELNVNQNIPEK
jgi:hypothetical protein